MAKPVEVRSGWLMRGVIQENEMFRKGPIVDPDEPVETPVSITGDPCPLKDAYYCYDAGLLKAESGGIQRVKIVVDETGKVGECYGPKQPENPALLNQSCRVAVGRSFFSCAERPDLACVKSELEYHFSWFVPTSNSAARLPKPVQMPELDSSPRRGTPLSPCGSLMCPEDYPARSLALGEEGRVTFQILVSEQGSPLLCWIFEASGHPELDNATCGIMLSRMRFNPATDANGNSIQSVYTNQISWRIPE
jgi:TonB family protein